MAVGDEEALGQEVGLNMRGYVCVALPGKGVY